MRLSFRTLEKFIVLFLVCSFLISCCSIRKQIAASPVIQLKHWGNSWSSKPWFQRLQPAPKELIQYVLLQNKLDEFNEEPQAVEPSPEITAVLQEIKSSLSPALNKLLDERLIGIFCLKDLGSSGFAEEIPDRQGGKTYAVIVLDQDILLSRKANDWATWKESSIFRPPKEDGSRLQMIIEAPENNTVQNAVRYLLLHELGHVLGTTSNIHPHWTPSASPISLDYSFVKLSWRPDSEGKPVSLFENKFEEQKKIKFYAFAKAQLTNSQMEDVYRKLQQSTNFVSMQAAANLWEDFAETFVTYVHVVRSKRRWQVRIEDGSGGTFVVRSCWQESRCRTKREFMDRWYEQPL